MQSHDGIVPGRWYELVDKVRFLLSCRNGTNHHLVVSIGDEHKFVSTETIRFAVAPSQSHLTLVRYEPAPDRSMYFPWEGESLHFDDRTDQMLQEMNEQVRIQTNRIFIHHRQGRNRIYAAYRSALAQMAWVDMLTRNKLVQEPSTLAKLSAPELTYADTPS